MIDAMENAGQLPQFHLDSDRLINGFEAEATSAVHNNLSRDLGQRLTLHDQERVLPGGSFRAAENFSQSSFHEAVAQLAVSYPDADLGGRKV